MQIQYFGKKLNQTPADCEVIFVVSKNFKHKWVKDKALLDRESFTGEAESLAVLSEKKKVYIGVENLEHDNLRLASAGAVKALKNSKFKSFKIGLYAADNLKRNTQAMVEGFLLGAYAFDKYKTKKEKNSITKIIIAREEYDDKEIKEGQIKEAIKEGQIMIESVNYVRDIVNLTPTDLNPVELAKMAKEMAKIEGLEIKVYDDKFLTKQGMGAFLGVSRASSYPSQLIHIVYKPTLTTHSGQIIKRVAIVGKGLTYDSGGLSLKPSKYMTTMKSDEAGAAVVLGIIKAVNRLKLPIEVHAIAGVTENVVNDKAYKPDDVLQAKNGKTIEVRNTDAEGRLVLADCLCYAQDFKPDYIIDLATLTGACQVALGEYTIGLMGHNNELKDSMRQAGLDSGELIGDLPFNKYLLKLNKSEVADISNLSGSDYGGAITGALFLSEFIQDEYKNKWIHLDIAGPAYLEKSWGYNPYGASGAGVRLVVEWIKQLANDKQKE